MIAYRVETMLKTRDKVEWEIWRHEPDTLPARMREVTPRTKDDTEMLEFMAQQFLMRYEVYKLGEVDQEERNALRKELAISWTTAKDHDMTWAEYHEKVADYLMAEMEAERLAGAL